MSRIHLGYMLLFALAVRAFSVIVVMNRALSSARSATSSMKGCPPSKSEKDKAEKKSPPSSEQLARQARKKRLNNLRKTSPVHAVPECVSGGFSVTPMVTPDRVYLRTVMGGGTGFVTNKKELGVLITDFFDSNSADPSAGGVPQFVTNYYWDVGQNLFNNTGGAGEGTFCRVRKAHVWVLPKKGGITDIGGGSSVANSNSEAMFTVNCQVPGVPSAVTQESGLRNAYATNVQVTNVLPQIDTRWKKVLTVDYQKTFQSGTVRPFFSRPFSQQPQDFGSEQCLFQMSIVNSTDGSPYFNSADTDQTIRVKVQLLIDQPIEAEQQARLAVFRNEEFTLPDTDTNGAAYPGTSPQYVQMNLRSVLDNFR
jgi:hypothetical protein